MFEHLPTELSYVVTPEIAIYMPGRIVPTVMRGDGHVKYSFEATDQRKVLSVSVRDVRLRFLPFILSIDADQDGQLEDIELTNVEIDTTIVDRKASRGTLNLETGDFDMVFAIEFTSKQISLLERLKREEMRFSIAERGRMDLETGSYEMHPAVIEIKEGPLAGARIRNWSPGILIGPPDPRVWLYIEAGPMLRQAFGLTLQPPQPPPEISCKEQNETTVCPGDPVHLCWKSNEVVKNVNITRDHSPKGYPNLPPTGDLVDYLPTASAIPISQRSFEYRAETVNTNPGYKPASSTVTANIYRGQWLGPFKALPSPEKSAWFKEIHFRTYSGTINVVEVRLLGQTDAEKCLGEIDWSKWFLEHCPPPPPYGPGGQDIGTPVEFSNPLLLDKQHEFRAAGDWVFRPMTIPGKAGTPDSRYERRPVCFEFRGECRPL